MNLLVGATGFVGGHLVEYLFQQGEISKGTFRMGSHLKILDGNGVMGIEVDLFDHHSLHEAMEGVDVVYNLASPMPGMDEDFMRVNTEGILSLLESAKEANVKAFLHLSSLDVYGFRAGNITEKTPTRPNEGYQRSKLEAERLLREYAKRNDSPKIVIARAARAIGSRDESLVIPLLRMIDSGTIEIPDQGPMSFTHPLDIAQALFKASSASIPTGSLYLLKSFDSSPASLARQLAGSLGKEPRVKKPGLLGKGGLPSYAADQLKAALRVEEQSNWKEIGYEPIFTVEKTCGEIAAWHRKEPWATEPQ